MDTQKHPILLKYFPPHSLLKKMIAQNDDLQTKAKQLFESSDYVSMESFLSSLSLTEIPICTKCKLEKEEAEKLRLYCIQNYPNSLALHLGRRIQSTKQNPSKIYCVIALHSLLVKTRSLSPIILNEIKQIILYCLRQYHYKTFIFRLISRIASEIASQIFDDYEKDQEWTELLDYLVSTFKNKKEGELEKGLLVFRDTPLNMNKESFFPYVEILKSAILRHLNPRRKDGESVWVLALGAGVSFLLQLVGTERDDLMDSILYRIMKSIKELVIMKKQVLVRSGIEGLGVLVYKERKNIFMQEYKYLFELMTKIKEIAGLSKDTKMAADNVFKVLRNVRKGLIGY